MASSLRCRKPGAIRKACGREFLIVTPGVRPKDSEFEPKSEDQSRKATPTEAIRAGADFLVVGRPIIAATDPPPPRKPSSKKSPPQSSSTI